MKHWISIMFANAGWKVTSLLMAFGLWMVIWVAVVEEDEANRADDYLVAAREFPKVPIIVQTSSTDTNRYRLDQQTVNVQLKGESTLLESFNARRIRVVADLTRQSGEQEFAVTLEVTVPPEFELQYCDPQSIGVETIR